MMTIAARRCQKTYAMRIISSEQKLPECMILRSLFWLIYGCKSYMPTVELNIRFSQGSVATHVREGDRHNFSFLCRHSGI